MKLNELVCPSCGLKCLVDTAYTTCASCNTFFYACQSRSVDNPTPPTQPGYLKITWPPIQPPSVTCGVVTVTDTAKYQVIQ